jgi:hypothetical protein
MAMFRCARKSRAMNEQMSIDVRGIEGKNYPRIAYI